MREKTYSSRFSDAPWLLKNKPTITVGGAGGISSWLILFLERTNNFDTIIVYEFDSIDETNMAGQCFRVADIGKNKSVAISEIVREFNGTSNVYSSGKFEGDNLVTPITLSGFDNMKARKDMFEAWKSLDDREIFIDGRMLFEDGQVYAVTKGNESRYEETLFNDDEIPNETCSMKATTHCGAHVASVMVAILNNYLANKYHYNDDIRDVPFSYVFSFAPFLIESNV